MPQVAPPRPPTLVDVSDTQVLSGWCYLCNTTVEADVQTHFNENHSTPASKPRVPIRSWEHRLDQAMVDLGEIRQEEDPNRQIDLIDEVLKELYLVRHRLAQLKGTPVKRVKEGSDQWE